MKKWAVWTSIIVLVLAFAVLPLINLKNGTLGNDTCMLTDNTSTIQDPQLEIITSSDTAEPGKEFSVAYFSG